MENTIDMRRSTGMKWILKEVEKHLIRIMVYGLISVAGLGTAFYFSTRYTLKDHGNRISGIENNSNQIPVLTEKISEQGKQLKETKETVGNVQTQVNEIYKLLVIMNNKK